MVRTSIYFLLAVTLTFFKDRKGRQECMMLEKVKLEPGNRRDSRQPRESGGQERRQTAQGSKGLLSPQPAIKVISPRSVLFPS